MVAALLLSIGLGLLAVRERVDVAAVRDAAAIHRMIALRGDQAGLVMAGSLWAEGGDLTRAQRALAAVTVEPESTWLRAGLSARGAECSDARAVWASVAYCDTEAECESRLRAVCASQGSSFCARLARRELAAFVRGCGEPQLFKLAPTGGG
jgi:hypothetical protein